MHNCRLYRDHGYLTCKFYLAACSLFYRRIVEHPQRWHSAVDGQEHPVKSVQSVNPYLGSTEIWKRWCDVKPDYTGVLRSLTSGPLSGFTKAFKKAEINHINDVIQKGIDEDNSMTFWRYVKSRRQDSVGVPSLKKIGQLINASKEKPKLWLSSSSPSSQETVIITSLTPGREPDGHSLNFTSR